MDWQEQLISVYLFVCKEYDKKLGGYITRLSNHSDMSFSDEEVITIYLFGNMSGYSQVNEIYNYVVRHLSDWFPKLPSYPGFIQRINKISHLFEGLVESLLAMFSIKNHEHFPALMDAFPIILAQQGRRFKARVAQEIATPNGYCATKKLHYYGVKLHMIAQRQPAALPIPMSLGITDAGTAR